MKKKTVSRLFAAMSSAAVLVSGAMMSALPVSAEGASEDVKANEGAVIKVECKYDDVFVNSCAGFIINDNTIVTSKGILSGNARTILEASQGNNFNFDESKLKYYVNISNYDITATDAMANVGENRNNFAVMRLSSVIQFDGTQYNAVKLGDSDTIDKTDDVYTIGYSTIGEKTTVISRGEVSKKNDNVIEYTIQNPTTGFLGAPVLDSNGAVVALTVDITNDGYRAVPVNQIKQALDTFNISYTAYNSNSFSIQNSVTYSEPVIESSVNSVTESSVDTQPSVESSTIESSKEESIELPEGNESNNTVMIIIIAFIGVAVIVVIAIIVVLANKSKPKIYDFQSGNNNIPNTQGGNSNMGGGMPTPNPYQAPTPPPAPNPYQPPMPPQQFGGQAGAGETTLLNDEGAGETTILGGGNAGVPSGILMNLKTGDRIVINKPEFAIGKERSRVDFCISDDSSVSRLHLKIRVRAGVCYVVDMGSKNGTYLNGARLTPNEENVIRNGDRLKISQLEFEFRS